MIKEGYAYRKPHSELSGDDVSRFIKCLNNEPLYIRALFLFFIYSGYKVDVVLSLKWDEVNLETGVVHVNSSLRRLPGERHKEIKNGNVQTITLPLKVVKELKQWRAEQNQIFLKMRDKGEGFGYCFTNLEGDRLSYITVKRYCNGFREKYGFPNLNPYMFRHFYICQRLEILNKQERIN